MNHFTGIVQQRISPHWSRMGGSFKTPILTDDEIMKRAPSVFADAAHETRSERYVYIPTRSILEAMRKEGFQPVFAAQSRTRDAGRVGHTKHMVRFRHEDTKDAITQVGDTYPEIVLINSHDGTSSYHLNAGLFRVLCLNGMVCSAEQFSAVRVPHSGKIVEKVIEGSYTVLEESRRALDTSTTWRGITLSQPERIAFAETAHTLRFADHEGHVSTPIAPEQLLQTRRRADDHNDLWTTFNRVQENVIRGGLTGIARSEDGRTRRVSTREISGIDQNVKLNQALWALTEKMAALKAA